MKQKVIILLHIILQNPVNNSFTRVLNLEKRNQTIRDDILIEQGHLPKLWQTNPMRTNLKEMREMVQQNWITTPSK